MKEPKRPFKTAKITKTVITEVTYYDGRVETTTDTATSEATDWSQYWCLNYACENVGGPPCHMLDKEDYPLFENAADALKLHFHEKQQERERGAAATKEKRRQERLAKKQSTAEIAP